MTYDNNFFPNGIEDLPPSGIDAVHRSRVTGYTPNKPEVIDTGLDLLESPTSNDVAAQREDNPFLRLAVLGGVMGIVCFFLWGIFAFLTPNAPTEVAQEVEEIKETVEAEPDYQAQLALRDQFHSLEKKPEPQIEPATKEPTPAIKPAPDPAQPQTQSAPQPIPRPAPRPVYRPAPQPIVRAVPQSPTVAEPKITPQEQWLALANFGTGVSSRSIPQPRTRIQTQHSNARSIPKEPAPPARDLAVDNTVSQGELGILNRQRIDVDVFRPAPVTVIDRSIIKAKIDLPLVWNSSLAPEQQQSNQITLILEEPVYDINNKIIFERGSTAVVDVQSIDNSNGLVTAHVSQIDNTTFAPGELILRNKKRVALLAKANKRSNFGNSLLAGGVSTLSSFGQQMLIPESNSTLFNGNAVVTNQSRNSIGRDLAGSALDGFGSSLSSELEQRSYRNQIGDGGTIYTLPQNTAVYLTNIKPLKINL